MDDSPLHAGVVLRQKRTELGLSIRDVSRLTGIRSTIIEAIEAGAFDQMPLVYMRSFARRYARALGLDERELPPIEEPLKRTPISRENISLSIRKGTSSRTNTSNLIAFALLGAVGIAAGIFFLLPHGESSSSQPEEVSEAPVETLYTSPRGGLFDYFGGTPIDSLRLEAVAKDTVWISATIDGRRSEQITLRPGERRQWNAHTMVVVSIGNVGGVELYRNGQKLPPLGNRGEVVRSVKITATDIVTSTSSWAVKRDSVLEALRSRPAPSQQGTTPFTPSQSMQKPTPSRPSPPDRRRQEILRRAFQSQEITPVQPKPPVPSPSKPSSP
ncbi:MAG: DUF4115 domain-containing protein [Candidatus Kapabacteria bacterium]|nr:DUF4115 domain-containing protein [Candidatus Kapabacteria bacterium]